MEVLIVVLKILLMLCFCGLMAAPLLLEYLSFRKDHEKKITFKRFRLLVFSVLYFLAVTVAMVFLKDLLLWIRSWSVVDWICNHLAIPQRILYTGQVIAVMLLNAAIGFLFWFLLRFVRIGLKKKELVQPKGKSGRYTMLQKAERAVLAFFNQEKWFFAARILLFLCLSLSAVYTVLFLLYQLPAFFGAQWIPYEFLSALFSAGYLYPVLSLLPLVEAYFFLAGVELLEKECPALVGKTPVLSLSNRTNLKKVGAKCESMFKDYFCYQLQDIRIPSDAPSGDYLELTRLVAAGVEQDQRNPQSIKDEYLPCLDTIIRNDIGAAGKETTGVLVNGGFFTEFSMYFLRYMSAVLARGDNIAFICKNNLQIDETHAYLEQAFSQMYSLWHQSEGGNHENFDNPIWKILKISLSQRGEWSRLGDCSVLVTDLHTLCSRDFEQSSEKFMHLLDTVVYVDVLDSVNQSSCQMSMFDTLLKSMREQNALRARNSSGRHGVDAQNPFRIRYSSRQIKYVCFDDSRTPGLDRVLKNLLSVEFVSADAMKYSQKTIVCCYNYDGRKNDKGEVFCPQAAHTKEELGVVANMADYAISFGAEHVSVFADQGIPYADIAESISANANHGVSLREHENLLFNSPFYNPDNYRVIVAFDTEDNLPAAVRRYAAMTPDQPTLVMLFSRPYMLRDYYMDNIETLWKEEQIMRIPMAQSGKQNAIQKILVRANAGGISPEEMIQILEDAHLPDYKELLEERDLKKILRRILEDCGISQNPVRNELDVFEFNHVRSFDKDGRFNAGDTIHLRRQSALYAYISGSTNIRLITEDGEMVLPLPKNRMTQNFIVGQNLLHNGSIYTILSMDPMAGHMHVRHETGGRNNVSYQYLQDREYHIDWSEEAAERVYSSKHVMIGRGHGMTVQDVYVTVKRRPMEVLTKGYTPIDYSTLAKNGEGSGSYIHIYDTEYADVFKQTYRKYGVVDDPVCPSEMILDGASDITAYPNGALVMSVRVTGDFGENIRAIASLAAVMLGEILHSRFPSVADSVAVCPVLAEPFTDEKSISVLRRYPKAFCRGYEPDPKEFELLIIEDCVTDLGVISVLMSSGDDVLRMLFEYIHDYLRWYSREGGKSSYLYYGLQMEPPCFDFKGLEQLAAVLGARNSSLRFVDADDAAQYDVCDFCGKRYRKGTEITLLGDGRKMCKNCGANLASNDKKTLNQCLERARIYLESTYGITVDEEYEFCFESTVKIVSALRKNGNLSQHRDSSLLKSYVEKDKKIHVHVECSIPSVNLAELLVRELTHVWQMHNLPALDANLAEGHIALVGIQYLRFLGQNTLAAVRTTHYESSEELSGEGYRKLVRELLANPQYRNNPFQYLLDASGKTGVEQLFPKPVPADIGTFGKPYTPQSFDRVLDGEVPYFFYNRLTATQQKIYDILLEGIRSHTELLTVSGCSEQDVETASDSIRYDHPELFWYNTLGISGETVKLFYGASAEETAVLQRRIEEVLPRYLEGITDSMSAYETALRLHVKVISAVDYDTIALDKQKKQGGPAMDEIDYLRTICGVLLEGKAVCGGYARAMQYLLQKCGIESAEIVGNLHSDRESENRSHAWNILKIDGDYYYLDTTWDDSSNTVQSVKKTDLGFGYFCVTTEEMARTRNPDLCPTDVPLCSATRANYYTHNDLVLDSYNLERIREIAVASAERDEKFFTFKCSTAQLYAKALHQLCTDGEDCWKVMEAVSRANKQIRRDSYSYRYDRNLWTITILFKSK